MSRDDLLAVRRALIVHHKGLCAYCGRAGKQGRDPDGRSWTQDHVIPRSKGGKDTIDNLVLACTSCNSSKRDTDQAIYGVMIKHGMSRYCATNFYRQSAAYHMAEYAREDSWWLAIETTYDMNNNHFVITLKSPWPVVVTTFDQATMDAALDAIHDIGLAHWRSI